MTKLLVSVRNAEEAEIAIAGGADVIDVKEPTRGALGAPDLHVLRKVVHQVAGRLRVSVALGELTCERSLPLASLDGVQFAKFGLAGCVNLPDWPARWRQAIGELPAGVTPVAVAYADWQTVSAPDPHCALALGAASGCRVLLVDTFSKTSGTLIDWLKPGQLRDLVRATHACGCLCALAGSLGIGQIAQVVSLEPDFVAVRTAACAGGRTGTVDLSRVRRLAARVRRPVVRERPFESALAERRDTGV